MKYLLVLAVVLIAFYIWRNNRLTDRSDAAAPKPTPGKPNPPAIMVACLECGTHLPDTEAVRGRDGVYCSLEHQRQHEANAH
jgi:uncharacterized protein